MKHLLQHLLYNTYIQVYVNYNLDLRCLFPLGIDRQITLTQLAFDI